jgi:predicted dehydrogenase
VMSKTKVGLIGAGYIGMVHLEVLRRIGNIDIIAVADTNKNLADSAAAKYNIPKIYYSPDDLINDSEIDVVHNCTPNHVHFELNRKIIKIGKQLLSEKPLSINSMQSAELYDLAKKHNTLTAINFCYRYYPVVQEAAARVRQGDLGQVRAFMGHFLQDWLFYDTDYSWRLDPAFAGEANVIADLGSHWCDLIQFITGQMITEVMAELHTCIPKRKKPRKGPLTFSTEKDSEYDEVKINLDEYASLFIRLENGARGNFTTCQVAVGKKVDIEFHIFGSKESYSWSHVRPNELIIGHRDKANEIFYESSGLQTGGTGKYMSLPTGHPMGYHDAMYNLFKDYYEALIFRKEGRAYESTLPDFKTGHEKMCIIDTALRSSKSGKWEKVIY